MRFDQQLHEEKQGDCVLAQGTTRMRSLPPVADWSSERFRAHASGPRCITERNVQIAVD